MGLKKFKDYEETVNPVWESGNHWSNINKNTVNSLLLDTLVKQTPRVGPYFSLLPLFDSLRDRHQSYKASHKGVHLRENYCTQELKCRKVLRSLRYISQSNSSSYVFKVHNKHTLHSLPRHNLLEFLLFLYHSILSHFLMLQLVAQLDQPLIISNNSN